MSESITDFEPEFILYNSFNQKRKFDYDFECLDYYVIFICTGGSYKYDIEKTASGIASVGDAVLCPAGRRFNRSTLEPVSLSVIYLDVSKADDIKKLPAGKLYFDDFLRISSDLSMLPNGLCCKFKPFEQHFLLDIWYSIMRQSGLTGQTRKMSVETPDMSEARMIIERGFSKNLTVKGIAQELGYTTVAFIRKFKSAYGITPMNFIIDKRIKVAKSMLSETTKSIYEISSLCGYENEYYFSNSFKKQTGMSPRAFRKNIQV